MNEIQSITIRQICNILRAIAEFDPDQSEADFVRDDELKERQREKGESNHA